MSWHKIAFTEDEVEHGAPGKLEKEFRQTSAAAGHPREAVVFANERAADGIEYYFSPEASRVAEALLAQYGAAICPQPEPDDVRYALGHRATGDRILAHREES